MKNMVLNMLLICALTCCVSLCNHSLDAELLGNQEKSELVQDLEKMGTLTKNRLYAWFGVAGAAIVLYDKGYNWQQARERAWKGSFGQEYRQLQADWQSFFWGGLNDYRTREERIADMARYNLASSPSKCAGLK